MTRTICLILTFLALPLSKGYPLFEPRDSALTASTLLQIAPSSASCSGAEFPTECRTAAQAAPYINAAFARYHISHPAVQAALVSLMAFESGDFKYNVNHWPGVPGQGTRNMQSAAFNAAYAASIAALGPALAQVQGDAVAVSALVEVDEYSFASAAWFVVAQCAASYREAMWDGSQSGWEGYLAGCVGADPAESGRVEYWERAMGGVWALTRG